MTILTSAARRSAATMLALTLTLGLGAATVPDASAAVPATVRDPIARADRALAEARTLAPDHPRRATKALRVVKNQVRRANKLATAQIGRPPTDPESDDLPGPPAVFAVLALDHRAATTLVTLFNGQARPRVVRSLLLALTVTQRRRDAMLAKVIALPAEGDIDDYADQLADGLAIYTQEVNQVASALTTYSLTPAAHDGLEAALARAKATKAKVDAAFGGGE